MSSNFLSIALMSFTESIAADQSQGGA